jgi:hypothetical protein
MPVALLHQLGAQLPGDRLVDVERDGLPACLAENEEVHRAGLGDVAHQRQVEVCRWLAVAEEAVRRQRRVADHAALAALGNQHVLAHLQRGRARIGAGGRPAAAVERHGIGRQAGALRPRSGGKARSGGKQGCGKKGAVSLRSRHSFGGVIRSLSYQAVFGAGVLGL